MINSRYDEDLTANSFYQELRSDYGDLIKRAMKHNWIICVPRMDSFQQNKLKQEDFLTHILVPCDELPGTHYRSLNGKCVNVRNNKVIVMENEDKSSFCTQIMFEEVFYIENLSKYKVWCLESPLNQNSSFQENGLFNIVATLRDCTDFLWTASSSSGKILEQLDNCIEKFLLDNVLEKCSVQTLKELTNILYSKCVKSISNYCSNIKDRIEMQNLKLSIETYLHQGLYNKLFPSIILNTSNDDSNLNKLVRNLYNIQLRDLNIKQEFYDRIICAKRPLAKINSYCTILGKLNCLQLSIDELLKSHDSCIISTDELLPAFVFLLLKSNIPNWIANLNFLKDFHFCVTTDDERNSFLITTLEASLEYIKCGLCKIEYTELLGKNDDELNLFEQIQLGNYDRVQAILQKKIDTNKEKTRGDTKRLCHPLCSCVKCETILPNTTYILKDDRGCGPLHIACMYGKPQIVELLIENNANIESCDYSGATPLHYAAMMGHQNALLLLLHSGADINVIDGEKNTSLHFSCNNGHETCVKAMLYFSEHKSIKLNMNKRNSLGNTPLHLASKWGFETIVQILLEYGANPNVENSNKKTCLDVAHNLKIYQSLTESCIAMKNKIVTEVTPVILKNTTKNIMPKNISNLNNGFAKATIKSSKNNESYDYKETKKLELLLRAVAYGDLPLICYYLGLNNEEKSMFSGFCHPLCNCERCELYDFNTTKTDEMDINVNNFDGFTCLHVACLHGRTDIVKILIKNGANVNLVTKKGLAALHLACQTQRKEIVKALLETNQCNINLQDLRGNTSLHYACHENNQRIVELLVKNGANCSIKNGALKSPLQEAEEHFMYGLVKILREQNE